MYMHMCTCADVCRLCLCILIPSYLFKRLLRDVCVFMEIKTWVCLLVCLHMCSCMYIRADLHVRMTVNVHVCPQTCA